jgi:Zn-dependent protease
MYYHLNQLQEKPIRIGPYTTSKIEIRDLIKAWVAISLAFTIFQGNLGFSFSFLITMLFSGITVGIAFLFHELGHKIAAQHYGCFAEFRANDGMLVLAIIMSFMGGIFFAPGAVMIAGPVGKRRNGIISLAGPGTNFALAIIFLILTFYVTYEPLRLLLIFGHQVNSWIGLFNMIPFFIFDGKKIIDWSKIAYFSTLALGLMLLYAPELLKVIVK